MSADNWAKCSKCIEMQEEINNLEISNLIKLYGKIDAEEFVNKMEELKFNHAENLLKLDNRTFREDYEIGVYDGYFEVDYRGYCDVCKSKYNYKFSEKI